MDKHDRVAPSTLPQVCQRVLLIVADKPAAEGESLQPRTFFTLVQNITADAIAVGLPMSGTHYIPMPVGERVAIFYVDNRAAYRLEGLVAKVDLEHGPALLWIGLMGSPRRIQRRRFVRIDVTLPLRVREASSLSTGAVDEGEDGDDGSWQRGRTFNLSGGGVGLVTRAAFSQHSVVDVQIELMDQWLPLRGRVLRQCDANDRLGPSERQYAIAFTDIAVQHQDEIIRFVFAEQQRRRRSERGWG